MLPTPSKPPQLPHRDSIVANEPTNQSEASTSGTDTTTTITTKDVDLSQIRDSASGNEAMATGRSSISSKLLSRAQTMLRGATMYRGESADVTTRTTTTTSSTPSGDTKAFELKPTLKSLQRQKTILEADVIKVGTGSAGVDDDEEMKELVEEMDKAGRRPAQDSDYDTDLEEEFSE